MFLTANKTNLKKYAKIILDKEYTEQKEKELINLCCKKSIADYHDGYSHISFAIRDYLEDINKIMNAYGVESLYNDGIDLDYVNTGDTYNITIFYYKDKLRIGDWGSIAEKYLL
jgi:hypothetical protein